MSSPNDPGEPGGTERPLEQSDLSPRQRADRRRAERQRGAHAAETGPQAVPTAAERASAVRNAPTEYIPVVDENTPPPTEPVKAQPARPGGRPSVGLDERLNRFISGRAAPEGFVTGSQGQVPKAEPAGNTPWGGSSAQEPVRASRNADLPDLSGPVPRPPRTVRSDDDEDDSAIVVGPSRRALRASMQIRRVDPWATLKVSAVLSVVFFFVWMIAVALLYLVLAAMGVWSKLNENVGELITNSGGEELVSSGTIFGGALLIGLVNIVLMTAAATIGAFIYNLTADLVGGVEVTLADRD